MFGKTSSIHHLSNIPDTAYHSDPHLDCIRCRFRAFLCMSFYILSFWCSVHTKCFREKCSVQFTVWELATSTPMVKG